MKHVCAVVLLLAVSAAGAGERYASYIERSYDWYSFAGMTDDEIDGYFAEIEAMKGDDLTAAVKNYHKFVERFRERSVIVDGVRIPVPRRVRVLVSRDPALLQEYRRQYEPAAAAAYARATEARDVQGMHLVAELHYPTEHSLRAMRYLAHYHFDHGHLHRALYYIDLLRISPFGDAGVQKLREIIGRILERSRTDKRAAIDLAHIVADAPAWVGGVAISTVYPGDIEAFLAAPIVYPLVVTDDLVAVNTGRDVYAYRTGTGKHVWPPGPYHAARSTSLFKGDAVAGSTQLGAGRFGPNYELFFPAGSLLAGRNEFVAVLNRIDGPSMMVRLNRETGATLLAVSGDLLFRYQDDAQRRRGITHIGHAPAYGDHAVFVALQHVAERRELCQLVRYDLEQSVVTWSRQVYEARLTHAQRGDPLENVIVSAGPYVCVFSHAGFMGVYSAADGAVLWERSLLPDALTRSGSDELAATYFRPVATSEALIIEDARFGAVGVYDLVTGDRRHSITTGPPVWALNCGSDVILAVRNSPGYDLLRINPAQGTIIWRYKRISAFPGQIAGDSVYCSNEGEVLKVALASGICVQRQRLAGGVFPGRIAIGAEHLFVVNTSGLYAYALEGRP